MISFLIDYFYDERNQALRDPLLFLPRETFPDLLRTFLSRWGWMTLAHDQFVFHGGSPLAFGLADLIRGEIVHYRTVFEPRWRLEKFPLVLRQQDSVRRAFARGSGG
jgi:hypothetical protein